MFCVSCGQAVKEEWAHCIACGEELEFLEEEEDEDEDLDDELEEDEEEEEEDQSSEVYKYNCPEQDAKDFLTSIDFDHWRASGMPVLRFLGDHPVGMTFEPDSSQWYNFVRFAIHNLDEDAFERWVAAGCIFLSFFEDFEFTSEPDTELLTPFQVEQLIEGQNKEIWEAIGSPQMRRRADGAWFLSSALNLFRWREESDPITDDEVTELLDRLASAESKRLS